MKYSRNTACWCGSGLKYKKCHYIIEDKLNKYRNAGYETPDIKIIKTLNQIEGIRNSSKINIALLDYIADYVVEGITTVEIDRIIHNKTTELGGVPATLNYNGYPKSTCVSVNEVVCHGIPSEEISLSDGDILNIDVSTIYNGYFSDSSRMFCIGNVSEEKQKLVRIAKECMDAGIEQVKPGGFLGDVGHAVNEHAKKNGCTIVREIGGHGIGLQFHEDPWVSYVSKKGTGVLLVPGMVFTVEPMVNMGAAKVFADKNDEWTVYTADGLPSAQWEKTVLVTESGCEILTY